MKPEVAAEKGFNSVNEFRAQAKDQGATFAKKVELDGLAKRVEELKQDIADLRESRENVKGHTESATNTWTALLGVGGFVMATITMLTLVLKSFH